MNLICKTLEQAKECYNNLYKINYDLGLTYLIKGIRKEKNYYILEYYYSKKLDKMKE